MRKCPKCQQMTLDFDEYFERFRCHNLSCGWMPPSTTTREINRLCAYEQPCPIKKYSIEELGIVISASYDHVNDALIFDFGLGEASFDMPEGDGRIIWRISHQSRSVTGLIILDVMKIDKITINILAKIQGIENVIKSLPKAFLHGRPTRVLIEKVEIMSQESKIDPPPYDYIFSDALKHIKQSNGCT
ncbi:MAG TPA: hypothetical protein VM658_03375 [bacterium]|nr:hypothetical protein [bacterium]